MRLIEMQGILKRSMQELDINQINILENDGKLYKITGHHKIVDNINELEKISSLKSFITPMEVFSAIYNNYSEQVYIQIQQFEEFKSLLKNLRRRCNDMYCLINDVVEEQKPSVISIKFPEVSDLSKLADYIKRIEKLLQQLVCNSIINGKVELSKVDSGSVWIDICLGCIPAVSLVGTTVWAAAVIRKKYLEGDVLKSHIESLGIKNDALQSIKNQLDNEIKNMNSIEIENIISKNNLDRNDTEYKSRVKFVIDEFIKLFNEGFEIHKSVTAPEEVANLFPDFKKMALIETKIPKLTENSESQE